MRLLVAIVNYRTPELTIDCLRSLEPEVRTLGDVRVVVADNASGDGSPELVRAAIAENDWTRWASLLPLERNGGFSFGNNAIIGPALASDDKPEFVLLLNSDTVVCGGALVALLDFMESHPAVGIAGSRVDELDGTRQHSRYRFHSVWSELDHGFRLGFVTYLLRNHSVAPPLVDKAHVTDWVVGASMIVRRKVFEDIGLLDPEYFLYYEEADFCLNARRAGWSCWYVPASRIVHLVGRSSGITNPLDPPVRRPRYWFESRQRYFVKNHGRAYALCADAAWVVGYASWRVRRMLQGKPDTDPPHLLWDFLRHRLRPRRPLSRALLLATLTFALAEASARVLTHRGANGMPQIGSLALLPYRPTAARVREFLAKGSDTDYVVHDAELGWTIRPDGSSTGDDGQPLYRANHQGIRAPPGLEYGPEPPPGKVRIVTLGDSFTHGDDVRDAETWQHDLETQRGDVEVLNLGVPGFGTDQALLRWRRDGRRFRSQLVVLGIWPENVCRNLGVVRYYLVPSSTYASKPRMVLEQGVDEAGRAAPSLEVLNSPVMARDELIETLSAPESHPLLSNDYWYRPEETRPRWYQELRVLQLAESLWTAFERKRERERLYSGDDPAGIELTVAIARQFAREVRECGSTPLVLMIPMREQLAQQLEGEPVPLVQSLRREGLDVLDMGPPMARASRARGERLYTASGHQSAEGNQVFAELLGKELDRWIQSAKL